MLKNQKGFSLVEIVAVLIIMSIVAGIAVAKMSTGIENAKIEGGANGMIDALNAAERQIHAKYMMQLGGSPVDDTFIENDLQASITTANYPGYDNVPAAYTSPPDQTSGASHAFTYKGGSFSLYRHRANGSADGYAAEPFFWTRTNSRS